MDFHNIAILNCDVISGQYAALYASGGYRVVLYDVSGTCSDAVFADIRAQMDKHEREGLLKGTLSKEKQLELVSSSSNLEDVIRGAFLIQYSAQDKPGQIQEVWKSVEKIAAQDAIFITSSSSVMPSELSEKLKHRENFLVMNHIDPLYYLRAIEIVPAPWTDPQVVDKVIHLLKGLGQIPSVVKKEVPGFLINRLQSALMRESYRLVHDGVITAAECDTLMTNGIGRRYAIMGQWETVYLDCGGMNNLRDRYGDMVYNTQLDLRPALPMRGPTLDAIKTSIEEVAGPPSNVPLRRERLHSQVAALVRLKQKLDLQS